MSIPLVKDLTVLSRVPNIMPHPIVSLRLAVDGIAGYNMIIRLSVPEALGDDPECCDVIANEPFSWRVMTVQEMNGGGFPIGHDIAEGSARTWKAAQHLAKEFIKVHHEMSTLGGVCTDGMLEE